ncbi:MAG TPA: NAD(P)H-hydrate epimerase [Thermoguttaceae bacterium]|nr:NAD(P)H-hydrate epimerase [Thermoguttaceae bacterium]
MSRLTITRDQARRIDQRAIDEYGIPGMVLMENAGRGVADRLCQLVAADLPGSRRVVLCCGKGNNAGDGFVIARHLDLRGYDARVLLWAEPSELTGDAAANFRILEKTDVPIEIFAGRHDPDRLGEQLSGAAYVVDALLGTGARGEPRPPLDGVIDQLNGSGVPILAVDLPSGLDCDTGDTANHTIRATVTCTFLAAKVGFTAADADQYTGRVHILDIGAPRKLIEDVLGDR